MKDKGSPNWVRYDKAGKVAERRWYRTGGIITTDALPPEAKVDLPGERRIARGAVIEQGRLV